MNDNAQAKRTSRRSGLIKALGPGIMYAGAAIGVSHLVQATRAGAGYGFALVWVVIVVHLLKYPFFEFAHRYTAATGENLLVGYKRVGRWALIGFLAVALALSIPSAAVLTIVTAGMASQMFTANLTPITWAIILLVFCAGVLASGGFPLLDKLMKTLMAFLAVCTLVAVIAAAGWGTGFKPVLDSGAAPVSGGAPVSNRFYTAPEVWNVAGVVFLVALMGWMPTPVDASAWPSLWMQERARQTGHRATLREALFDFNLGYAGSLVAAVMFLSLGALVMFGTGEKIAGKGHEFAAQFVNMYVSALGSWSRPVIVTAAFITMLSTMLTVLDGYPRVLTAGCRLAWPSTETLGKTLYWVVLIIMMGGAMLIYRYLTSHMQTLVDFATTLAFLSAPLFAYLNYRVISSGRLPQDAAPPKWLLVLTWIGLTFLTCFSIVFLIVRFGYA